MRKLGINQSINLNGSREFNHLRITDIEGFLDDYRAHYDVYQSPFKILQLLEDKIKFENNPPKIILIPYKDDGDIIFHLVGIRIENDIRIVEYCENGLAL